MIGLLLLDGCIVDILVVGYVFGIMFIEVCFLGLVIMIEEIDIEKRK